MTRLAAATLLLPLVGAAGCYRSELDHRFEADTGCENVTSKHNLGAGLIEVRGCGMSQRYVCGGHHTCVRESSVEPTLSSSATVERHGQGQGVHLGRAGDGSRAVRLVLRDGQSKLTLLGVPSVGDQLRVQATDSQDEPIGGCSGYRFITVRASEGVDVPLSTGTVALSDLRGASGTLVAVQLCNRRLRVSEYEQGLVREFLSRFDEIAGETEAPTSEQSNDDPNALRAQVERNEAAVLACLGGEAGAIQLSWESGELTVRLAGAAESDSVHGCVEAALGSIQVPAGSGELMHPIAP